MHTYKNNMQKIREEASCTLYQRRLTTNVKSWKLINGVSMENMEQALKNLKMCPQNSGQKVEYALGPFASDETKCHAIDRRYFGTQRLFVYKRNIWTPAKECDRTCIDISEDWMKFFFASQ